MLSWLNLKWCPGICLERRKTTMEISVSTA